MSHKWDGSSFVAYDLAPNDRPRRLYPVLSPLRNRLARRPPWWRRLLSRLQLWWAFNRPRFGRYPEPRQFDIRGWYGLPWTDRDTEDDDNG